MVHTSGATAAAVALAAHPALGWLYLVPVALAAVVLIFLNARLIIDPSRSRALALFHASNLCLATVLIMVCVDTLVSRNIMPQTQKLLEVLCT